MACCGAVWSLASLGSARPPAKVSSNSASQVVVSSLSCRLLAARCLAATRHGPCMVYYALCSARLLSESGWVCQLPASRFGSCCTDMNGTPGTARARSTEHMPCKQAMAAGGHQPTPPRPVSPPPPTLAGSQAGDGLLLQRTAPQATPTPTSHIAACATANNPAPNLCPSPCHPSQPLSQEAIQATRQALMALIHVVLNVASRPDLDQCACAYVCL